LDIAVSSLVMWQEVESHGGHNAHGQCLNSAIWLRKRQPELIRAIKKPTQLNPFLDLAASAYSLTNLPVGPGCPSISLPKLYLHQSSYGSWMVMLG
jgi:hypothetical protein